MATTNAVPIDDIAAQTPAAADAQPAPRSRPATIPEGKSVLELQALIEEAFGLLEKAADTEPETANRAEPEKPGETLGAAAGSELRYQPTMLGRLFKTIIGVAILLVVGVIPLQRVLAPSSDEAFVNVPSYSVLAPVAGKLSSEPLDIGTRVASGQTIADVVGADSTRAVVAAPNAGKIWDVFVHAGDRVAAGQEIARVVGCTATGVTASVSGAVYDRLVPGMSARFHFYGERRTYAGTVAKLTGHSVAAGLALVAESLRANSFYVYVSVPDLGAMPSCAVGRRGAVVFGRAN